jgi:ActR/RegA family two-component response regulator
MDNVRSRLVLIVSDDEGVSHVLGRCAISNGASVYVTHERIPQAISALSAWLAAVVVDVRSPEFASLACEVIELLRQNEDTAKTPVLLRYDKLRSMTSSLLRGFDSVYSVDAETGIPAVCEALATVLGHRPEWTAGAERQLVAGN